MGYKLTEDMGYTSNWADALEKCVTDGTETTICEFRGQRSFYGGGAVPGVWSIAPLRGLAVCQVLYVARHPASRRRSYFKFSARMRLDRLESSTPEDHGASQRTSGNLRSAGPWVDNEKRFSQHIGYSWAWRIGVRHSLGCSTQPFQDSSHIVADHF